jgi:hypothetical protein
VFPQRLPGTSDILFAFWGRTFYNALLQTETRKWREITPPSKLITAATYATSGHLLNNDGAGAVIAARWDPTMTGSIGSTSCGDWQEPGESGPEPAISV